MMLCILKPPPINAFNQIEKIKNDIFLVVDEVKDGQVVVLAGFGPASKVLAFDLAGKVQVIDIGHGIEVAYGGERKDYILP
jgi:hypothetical protein